MNKRLYMISIFFLGFIVAVGLNAVASGSIALIESHTNRDDFSVYVRGVQPESDVSVQIATTQADSVEMNLLSDSNTLMQTLVLVDNSISIPKKDRNKISEFVQDLISDRFSNEKIAIATFSEEVNMLTEYTDDYSILKKALESIEYMDQETYLTDVLYDWISGEYIDNPDDIFRRIIVISDGVDNKSFGYTKDELYALIKGYSIPIYTIGCSTGKNNNELENMFALSRSTFANYFIFDEIEDTLDIVDVLSQDKNIVKITVKPSKEIMDGGKKTVKITFGDGSSVSSEIVMPQILNDLDEKNIENSTEIETVGEEVEADTDIYDEEEKNVNIVGVIVVCAIILLVILVVVILIIVSRKKKTVFEQADESIINQIPGNNREIEHTEFIEPFRNSDNGNTIDIFDQRTNYQIVLTDVKSPAKSFYVPLRNSIIIGRHPQMCDILIDYDNSVSGKHCEIITRNGKFYIKDLQSSNGTFINGIRVLAETEIYTGNVLKLGRVELRFEVR